MIFGWKCILGIFTEHMAQELFGPAYTGTRVITMSDFYTSGVKTFVNEFAAYDELGKLIDNKATFYNWTENYNRTWSYTGDLDITFYPDNVVFNTTDVLYYGYIQVSDDVTLYHCTCSFEEQ